MYNPHRPGIYASDYFAALCTLNECSFPFIMPGIGVRELLIFFFRAHTHFGMFFQNRIFHARIRACPENLAEREKRGVRGGGGGETRALFHFLGIYM